MIYNEPHMKHVLLTLKQNVMTNWRQFNIRHPSFTTNVVRILIYDKTNLDLVNIRM